MVYHSATRLGVIALDEGIADEERPPSGLLDRLAFHLNLSTIAIHEADELSFSIEEIVAARACLSTVQVSEADIEALCATAAALGIASARAPLLALRAARAAAALAGRSVVSQDDVKLAGRLVLGSRATVLPAPPDEQETADESNTQPDNEPSDAADDNEQDDSTTSTETQAMCDVVLEATRAAIPANLLAQILAGRGRTRSRASSVGRAGALQHSKLRGRPVGVKRGEPRAGVRLNVLETLRAAAPWQRRRRAGRGEAHEGTLARIEIRREDFHVTRLKQRAETTTIFAVDASGSSALHRLAETKGAIELLLADCYVRRDRVALVAFRGSCADLLLPPTRSLVRVKRSLAALPGGGGTPLASGIDAGTTLATAVLSRGGTPTLVLLTDGRANIARDGKPGRPQAEEEALIAARRVRETQFTTLLIDTSPHPHPFAQRLAAEMGARYVALPHADSAALSQAVMMARE